MAVSRVKTWLSGEVLTAADLNAEFNNVLDNGQAVGNPWTASQAAGGFDLTGLDETAFDDAATGASAAGRLRRNATKLSWHDGTSARDVLHNNYASAATLSSTLTVTGAATVNGTTLTVAGHFVTSGSAPSVGSCGSSPSVSGSDTAGLVTTGGGGPTSCVVTFAAAFSNAPRCTISPHNSSALSTGAYAATTTTTLTLTHGACNACQWDYHCVGV